MKEATPKINPSPKTLEEAIAVIEQLIAMVAELKAENVELKEKLKLNSQNSSLPPSKDLRKPKKPKKSSGRKQGGQPGHRGAHRSLLPEASVDRIIDCQVCAVCDDCKGQVDMTGFQRHQVYDIPKPSFEVTEYRKQTGVCLSCKKKHQGQFPVGVTGKMLGPRTHAFIGLSTSKFRLSKRLVVNLLQEVYGLPVSLGCVSNVEETVKEALSAPYEEVKTALQSSPVVHVDETGHKEKNKNGWAWILADASSTLFSVSPSRGKKVAQALIGCFSNRIFVTDRYPAYDWLPDAHRQLCWAHLKRDFKKIAEREGPSGKIGFGLLKVYRKLFDLWLSTSLDRRLHHQKTNQWFRRYQRTMMGLLTSGTHLSNKKTARTCQNLLDRAPALWTFWSTPGVPPTNNQAERQLRPLVISKKLTFGTQSARGSQFIERIFTVVMTCQQQRKSILPFLEGCMAALFSKQTPPNLIQSQGP